MTVAERKINELAALISAHRIVKVTMQAEHAVCIAHVDMPEYGICAGDTFHLFTSSYAGYAYIVTNDGCGCKSYEHRHGCKHNQEASKINASRYFAHKSSQKWDESDTAAHALDDLTAERRAFLALPLEQRQQILREQYPDDYYCDYAA
ncbi:MAG: hypothetical protein ACRDHW_00310 [Ktedonobacteraceae bacterium]